MTKKFYQQEEFRKLRYEWYEKLNKKGFDDLEYYRDHKGMLKQSKFIRSTKSAPNRSQIRSAQLQNQYNYYRNFLFQGPFYQNLKEYYSFYKENQVFKPFSACTTTINPKNFKTFKAFLAAQPLQLSKTQYYLFELWLSGTTIREISKEMRRLQTAGKLTKTAKPKKFSVFWCHYHIKIIKQAAESFQYESQDCKDCGTCEDCEAVQFDPASNKPLGEF